MSSFKKHPRRVLITGATGYVGGQLAKRLVSDGREVHALVRSSSDTEFLEKQLPEVAIHKTAGEYEQLKTLVAEIVPETIFHLAAQVTVNHNEEDFEKILDSNVLFGTRLLEAVRNTSACYWVNAGSYWQHFDGEDYDPVNLYAAAKQAFQDVLKYYAQSGCLKAISLKLFDVYGPGDSRQKIFRLFEEAVSKGETLKMSPGEQELDLVFIDDVVGAFIQAEGILMAGSGEFFKDDYAVSSGKRTSLREVAALYSKISGKTLPIEWGGRPYRPREVMQPWRGDNLPGWKAEISLDEGIQRLVEARTRQPQGERL